MLILAIDPGSNESGFVIWNTQTQEVKSFGTIPNVAMVQLVHERMNLGNLIAIEVIRGYGIVAGDDTFDTCIWIGRFDPDCAALLIPRKDIKRFLCGNTTTNDKYVRQALIDRIGIQGTKLKPGPLYGISGHCWSALAVAVTAEAKFKETINAR